MAPPEAPQEGSQRGWRLDYASDGASRPAGAQHVGVVNAVAARQRRGYQGQHLVSRIRPPRRISEVNVVVDEFTQTQVLGEGDREEQPGIGHQAVVVEGDLNAVGDGQVVASIRCLLVSGWFSVSKTIIPEAQEHFLTPFARRDTHPLGGLGFSWLGFAR